jgi:protein-disulfide isomerase
MGQGSRGRKGGRARAGPAVSSSGPGRGGSSSLERWIVSANLLALLAVVLAVVALVLHPFVDENGGGSAPAVAQLSPTAEATPTPVVVENVSVDDDPSIGPEDAPVTIVMFTDYQ